jgi:hypothetical protein
MQFAKNPVVKAAKANTLKNLDPDFFLSPIELS